MTTSDDGKTFTFTNAKRQKLIASKKSATGSDELPGAKLVVCSVGSDGTQSEIDSWKTESTPHEMQLSPGQLPAARNLRSGRLCHDQRYYLYHQFGFYRCRNFQIRQAGWPDIDCY